MGQNIKKFVLENRSRIAEMKVNDCLSKNSFVFLSYEGKLKIGDNRLHGYHDIVSFGGPSECMQSAYRDIDYIVQMDINF